MTKAARYSGIHSIYTIVGAGGIYVGCTSKPVEQRWKEHLFEARAGSTKPLYVAIREHGASAFTIAVVACARGYHDAHDTESEILLRFQRSGELTVFNRERVVKSGSLYYRKRAAGKRYASVYEPCPHCDGLGNVIKQGPLLVSDIERAIGNANQAVKLATDARSAAKAQRRLARLQALLQQKGAA